MGQRETEEFGKCRSSPGGSQESWRWRSGAIRETVKRRMAEWSMVICPLPDPNPRSQRDEQNDQHVWHCSLDQNSRKPETP